MNGSEYENVKKIVDEILNTKRVIFWDFDFGKSLRVVRIRYFNP